MARSLRIGGIVGHRAIYDAAARGLALLVGLVRRNAVVERVLAAAEASARRRAHPAGIGFVLRADLALAPGQVCVARLPGRPGTSPRRKVVARRVDPAGGGPSP
jgi:hypothetical protein